tara:strand:+ start:551 stop:760 length:210 start_codon:yes stop_codon:yes gene_type:complete
MKMSLESKQCSSSSWLSFKPRILWDSIIGPRSCQLKIVWDKMFAQDKARSETKNINIRIMQGKKAEIKP